MGRKLSWTTVEDEIIRTHYPAGGIDGCYHRLRKNKRTANSIYVRARKLGLAGGELSNLRKAVKDVLDSARFAGSSIVDLTDNPENAHQDSICTVNMRAMLRLKALSRQAPHSSSETKS